MVTQCVLGQAGHQESRARLRDPDCPGLRTVASGVEKAGPPQETENGVWAEPGWAPQQQLHSRLLPRSRLRKPCSQVRAHHPVSMGHCWPQDKASRPPNARWGSQSGTGQVKSELVNVILRTWTSPSLTPAPATSWLCASRKIGEPL